MCISITKKYENFGVKSKSCAQRRIILATSHLRPFSSDVLLKNAETSNLHPIVMCTSKSENVHPFFSIRHRAHQNTSLVTKLQAENTGVVS
jgi:hypothetical protein